MMAKFKRKPIVYEAVQWTGENIEEISKFANSAQVSRMVGVSELVIETLGGNMIAEAGDWIIKGVKGEFYPCKPDVFQESYELAEVTDG